MASASFGGLCHDTLPSAAGTGWAADNNYVGVTGTFLSTAAQGVWSTARLDFSAPHFGAFGGSILGLVQQSAGALDMQIRASAFKGESVSVTDLLADSLALTARPRWTGSPHRATWAATSCCATM